MISPRGTCRASCAPWLVIRKSVLAFRLGPSVALEREDGRCFRGSKRSMVNEALKSSRGAAASGAVARAAYAQVGAGTRSN